MTKRPISKQVYRPGWHSKGKCYGPSSIPEEYLTLVFIHFSSTDCELVIINHLFLMTCDQWQAWEGGLVKVTGVGSGHRRE